MQRFRRARGIVRSFALVCFVPGGLCDLVATSARGEAGDDPETLYFREQVEPILRERCYGCHSHTSGEMEGGLTLDWRSGWKEGGGRGPAIVPGKPDESLLIRAISHSDPDLQMPDDKLPADEISVLTEWVRRGAADPRTVRPEGVSAEEATDWWSLRPLVRPPVPNRGGMNPIDAFVLDRLVSEGLTPAEEADRRTLIRRVTFDLHGLPPTIDETEAFAADQRDDAYDRLVDRLLGSPRYGERWARHWFDTIHFADSHGFEHDVFRPNAWRYRDYVIASFNRDTAWDRFIREQLAADVFFPEQPGLTAALGYLGAGPYDHSAATTAPMSFEYLDRDDLVTQTMGAFVSTTANCARCHAHKFDPITQEDYYALQAVFAGIGKGNVSFDRDASIAAERRRWTDLLAAAEQSQSEVLLQPGNLAMVAEWEAARGEAAVWRPLALEPDSLVSSDGATLQRLEDGSVLSTGARPEKDVVTVRGTTELSQITAVRLEVLTDESLPHKGPGRQDNGNLHLTEFRIEVVPPGATEGGVLAIGEANADFDQEGWTIQHAIDGNESTAWGIHPQVGAPHHAVFVLNSPAEIEPGAALRVALEQLHGRGHLIGRFRLSVTDGPPENVIALPADALAALDTPAGERTIEQRTTLAAAILRQRAEQELQRLPPQEQVYAAAAESRNERGVITYEEPREIRVLKRGDLNQPGEVVGPGALSAVSTVVDLPARFELPEAHSEAARRAALADWLADPRNPLTWRSIANRVWHYHFGRGLCDTPSDFGRMGGEPSHPELLDWLACELRDSGGSLKHLHRLICTSATYRRASQPTAQQLNVDPDNRLLARMSRHRLDADSYFDAVLAVSGRLNLTMSGPGIQHFSTSPGAQLTPTLDYNDFDWNGSGAGRRAVYRVVWRGIPDPLFDALDFPDLGLTAPTRGFSVSALQTLVLRNNRFVLHHAEEMARLVESARDTPSDQVRAAVRRTWLRDPTASEAEALTSLAERHGLAAVCRLLLNSNEFLFVE